MSKIILIPDLTFISVVSVESKQSVLQNSCRISYFIVEVDDNFNVINVKVEETLVEDKSLYRYYTVHEDANKANAFKLLGASNYYIGNSAIVYNGTNKEALHFVWSLIKAIKFGIINSNVTPYNMILGLQIKSGKLSLIKGDRINEIIKEFITNSNEV